MVASTEASFDPTRISKTLRKAGFTAGEIQITAVGILSKEGDLLALEMTGPLGKIVLAGGKGIDEITKNPKLQGERIRVIGKLHPSHAEKTPGITVEIWESDPEP